MTVKIVVFLSMQVHTKVMLITQRKNLHYYE